MHHYNALILTVGMTYEAAIFSIQQTVQRRWRPGEGWILRKHSTQNPSQYLLRRLTGVSMLSLTHLNKSGSHAWKSMQHIAGSQKTVKYRKNG